jgi:hypothetical protein
LLGAIGQLDLDAAQALAADLDSRIGDVHAVGPDRLDLPDAGAVRPTRKRRRERQESNPSGECLQLESESVMQGGIWRASREPD